MMKNTMLNYPSPTICHNSGASSASKLTAPSSRSIHHPNSYHHVTHLNNQQYHSNMGYNMQQAPTQSKVSKYAGSKMSMNSTVYPNKSIFLARQGETMNVKERGSKLLQSFGTPTMSTKKAQIAAGPTPNRKKSFPGTNSCHSQNLTGVNAVQTIKQQQLNERAKLVNEYLKHIFDAATLIIPQFLYLGGHSSVKNADSLQKMGVTHVLNMAQELKLDQRKLSEKNIKLMYIAAKDAKTYNIRSDFDTAFKFIDDALVSKGKIVINCARGISRSATIVIAYLMFRYKMSLMDSFGLIVRLRPQVRPNSNFRRQLQLYEQELLLHHHHHHHQKYNHTITKKY